MLIPILRWFWNAISKPQRQAMLKITVTVLVIACTSMILLDLRFAQQTARHEQGATFRDLDATRKEVWSSQAEIGQRTHPLDLMDRLDPTGLETLPVVDSESPEETATADEVSLARWTASP